MSIPSTIETTKVSRFLPAYHCNPCRPFFLIAHIFVTRVMRLLLPIKEKMQPCLNTTLFRRLFLFFYITLFFHSIPSLASPIDSQSLSFTPNYKIPQAAGVEVLPHLNHDNALTTVSKRGFITYYNNLGAWRMVLQQKT